MTRHMFPILFVAFGCSGTTTQTQTPTTARPPAQTNTTTDTSPRTAETTVIEGLPACGDFATPIDAVAQAKLEALRIMKLRATIIDIDGDGTKDILERVVATESGVADFECDGRQNCEWDVYLQRDGCVIALGRIEGKNVEIARARKDFPTDINWNAIPKPLATTYTVNNGYSFQLYEWSATTKKYRLSYTGGGHSIDRDCVRKQGDDKGCEYSDPWQKQVE